MHIIYIAICCKHVILEVAEVLNTMTDKELLYIVTIAEQHSITKAAESLYVSQPSLSQIISKLELDLGQKLFIRTSHGLYPTKSGEKYLSTAYLILKKYKDFQNEISDMNNLMNGKLVIGISNSLGSIILPDVLSSFSRQYPNIQVVYKENNSTELEKMLISGKIDIGIMHFQNHNIELDYEPICNDPFLFVIHKDHPINMNLKANSSKSKYIDLSLFANENFISVPPQQRIRQVTNNILNKVNIDPPFIFTAKNFETAKRLINKNLGVGIFPKQYLHSFSGKMDLDYYHIDPALNAKWTLVVTYTKDSLRSRVENAFISILKEEVIKIYKHKPD